MANQIVKLKKGSDYLYPYADFIGIDTTNVIASFQIGSYNWEATEDCIVIFASWQSDNCFEYFLDGVNMGKANSYGRDRIFLPIKKGQVFSFNNWFIGTIYGIKR